MSRAEAVALAAAVLACLGAARVLRWGIDRGDPRHAVIRQIRAEASRTRDVVVVTDEAHQLLIAAAPVPAVYGGALAGGNFDGFRRVYVVAPNEAQLVPYLARFGAPAAQLAPVALRWDMAGIAAVTFDLTAQLATGAVQARRDGGPHGGPCVAEGPMLRCHSPDDWNHLRADDHPMGGTNVRCVFAHPQAASRLVISVPALPAARMLVGAVGIDDRAYFPTGAPVANHIRFEPAGGGAPVELDVVAPNKRGVTGYRLALGRRPGALSFAITTPNAGARQYCFTAFATD